MRTMNKEMEEKEVLDLYLTLDDMGVRIWIDGGWSVDASLGRQTRRHADLDIAIEYHDLDKFRQYMESIGYKEPGCAEDTQWNFVLWDGERHEVDVHAFRLDENGRLVEGVEYPEGSLTGIGLIGVYDVRCIDPKHVIAQAVDGVRRVDSGSMKRVALGRRI
jgi:lincosamide nucleotidyltransferase A/C/D/E